MMWGLELNCLGILVCLAVKIFPPFFTDKFTNKQGLAALVSYVPYQEKDTVLNILCSKKLLS